MSEQHNTSPSNNTPYYWALRVAVVTFVVWIGFVYAQLVFHK